MEYERYIKELKKNKKYNIKPSIVDPSIDLEWFINQYHRQGIAEINEKDGSVREKINAGFVVGQYWNKRQLKYLDTHWMRVVYSKQGVHMFPVYGREE